MFTVCRAAQRAGLVVLGQTVPWPSLRREPDQGLLDPSAKAYTGAHRLQPNALGVGCRGRQRHDGADGAVLRPCPGGAVIHCGAGDGGRDAASAWSEGIRRSNQVDRGHSRRGESADVAGEELSAAAPDGRFVRNHLPSMEPPNRTLSPPDESRLAAGLAADSMLLSISGVTGFHDSGFTEIGLETVDPLPSPWMGPKTAHRHTETGPRSILSCSRNALVCD